MAGHSTSRPRTFDLLDCTDLAGMQAGIRRKESFLDALWSVGGWWGRQESMTRDILRPRR